MTVLAVSCLAVLVYTYVGYPLLVALWSRRFPTLPPRVRHYEPTVSVCFSVHDGLRFIDEKIRSLTELDYPPEKLEFLLFSDGSSDGTEERARELASREPRLRVLSSPVRGGKPRALNRLRAAARGEILLMCDVRQRLAPCSVRELVAPLSDPSVGFVSGSLVLAGNSGAGVYWRYEREIRRGEARLGRMVGVSGSIYAIRRAEMPELPADVLLDDMFVPLTLALSGKKGALSEKAEAYDDAFDDADEFRRKVRTLAGNYQIVALMPRVLLPGASPVWFQMLSHKVFRLMCPWALLLLLLTSAVLVRETRPTAVAAWFWEALFSAQVAFYALAALGRRARRLGALARTFLVLNASAVLGTWRYVRGSQAITW